MNAFVQSVKYGQTPKLEEANHLGIAGTVDILEHAKEEVLTLFGFYSNLNKT